MGATGWKRSVRGSHGGFLKWGGGGVGVGKRKRLGERERWRTGGGDGKGYYLKTSKSRPTLIKATP